MFKVNDTFHRVHFPDYPITIKEIQTHRKEGGKKVKLDKAIYTLGYEKGVTKTMTRYTEITTYESEIQRSINFNLWILT